MTLEDWKRKKVKFQCKNTAKLFDWVNAITRFEQISKTRRSDEIKLKKLNDKVRKIENDFKLKKK